MWGGSLFFLADSGRLQVGLLAEQRERTGSCLEAKHLPPALGAAEVLRRLRRPRPRLRYNPAPIELPSRWLAMNPSEQAHLASRRTVALRLISQAGELLHQGFGLQKDIHLKGAIDPVTQFDHLSESLLIDGLRSAFPTDAFVAEERGGAFDRSWSWFVDPLDGTVNFAHGIPIFVVSIGLWFEGAPVFGAILDPMRAELFEATLGQGAFANGRPIHVSAANNLMNSLLVTGFAYDVHTNPENNFREFAEFHLRSRAVRRLGAAALDLAYVAAGRFDGYWELQVQPWDVAAGVLIVREAGGQVTKVDGTLDLLAEPMSMLATNGQIHQDMLAILAATRATPYPAP